MATAQPQQGGKWSQVQGSELKRPRQEGEEGGTPIHGTVLVGRAAASARGT